MSIDPIKGDMRVFTKPLVVEVVTNDPTQPVLRLGAVGTGLAALPTVSWGQDYVGIQVTTPNNPPALHAVSDEVRDTLVPINRKWPIA